jgi:Domain of unknown function (DUF4412)
MTHPRRFVGAAVVTVTFAAGPAVAQPASFEGVVAYKLTGKGAATEMTQMYKGTKSRTEVTSGAQSTAMIMDGASGTMTILMPPQKQYMVMDMKTMGQGLGGLLGKGSKGTGGSSAGTPGSIPKITATGRKETIAGHECEYYVMGDKGEAEVCSAKGLGMFMMGQSPMGGGASSLAALAAVGSNPDAVKLFSDGFFPLKMISNEGGKKQVVLEATLVERKSLDASLFAPPPDYKEMKIPFGR